MSIGFILRFGGIFLVVLLFYNISSVNHFIFDTWDNFGIPGSGPELKKGMTLALEPMLNIGDWRTRVGDDFWTVLTADSSLSAHFEHTIAITDGEAEVLTVV